MGVNGAVANATADAVVDTTVESGAVLDSGRIVMIKASGENHAKANAFGITGGIVGVGINTANADAIGSTATSMGGSISADQDVTVLSVSSNIIEADAKGGSGAGVAVSEARTSASLEDHRTATTIGDFASITAEGVIVVEARMSTDANSDSEVDAFGAGVGATTRATTEVIGATTTTVIADGADLRGDTVRILARVTNLDADATADSQALALGADSDAVATTTTNSTSRVEIGNGADITGLDRIVVEAGHENLNTDADARAQANSLGGDTDSLATNTLTLTTRVDSHLGGTLTTHDLDVRAIMPADPIFSATAKSIGAEVTAAPDVPTP